MPAAQAYDLNNMNTETATTIDPKTRIVYRIPERNLDGLKKQLEKLNRRAIRLSVTPIAMRETGEEFELWASEHLSDRAPFQIRQYDGETLAGAEARCRSDNPGRWLTFFPRRFVLIEVAGESPKLAGWTFGAVLQHLEGGNILAHVPGFESKVPDSYRTAEPYCDHCQTNRQRKDTYIVVSDAGEWKQVGRQCLRDFTGHKDPHQVAEWAEALASFAGSCSAAEFDDELGGCGSSRWLSMQSFLEATAYAIRTEGWVSRKAARDSFTGLQSTADYAMILIRPARGCQSDLDACRKRAEDKHHDDDVRVAAESLAWAQALETTTDDEYLWNLRVLAHSDSIEIRQTGLAASMIAAYARATERELKRKQITEANKNSQYIGTVGERIELDLTMLSTKYFENDFGGSDLIVFVDDAGNRFKWWSSASNSWAPAIGGKYHVRASVKAHEVYNSIRETTLSRVQQYDPEAAAQAKVAAKEAAKQRAREKRANRDVCTATLPAPLDAVSF